MHTRRRLSSVAALVMVLVMTSMALVVSTPTARAAISGVNFGPVTTVASTSYSNGYSTVLEDHKDDTYVFYLARNPNNANNVNLNVSKYTNYGLFNQMQFVGEQTVNDVPNSAAWAYQPAAGIDHQGNLYVLWVRQTSVSGSNDIMMSKSVDNGTSWQPAVLVSASGNAGKGSDTTPAFAITPSGTLYATWLQFWVTGFFSGVNAVTWARSTNGGATWSTATNLTTVAASIFGGGMFTQPGLAADSQGRVYLVYSQVTIGFFTTTNATAVIRYTDGTSWTSAVTLQPSNTWGRNPTVAVDSQDHVHVAWMDYRQMNGEFTFWYRRSTNRGQTWGAEVLVSRGGNTVLEGTQGVLATYANNVLFVWIGSSGNGYTEWSGSPDNGLTWSPVNRFAFSGGASSANPRIDVDANDTFYMTFTDFGATNLVVDLQVLKSPPSAPTITGIARGDRSLTVSWTAPPEQDVTYYEVARSLDGGTTWTVIATVSAPTLSYTDSGLSNGTYFYQVDAVDDAALHSTWSSPMSSTVGLTTQEMIDALNAQIAALQSQLAAVNASTAARIAAAQAQITALQNALTNLQNSQTASNAATAAQLARLQANITQLQQKLNDLQNTQTQQATQTISYANLAFEIIVVVLLVVLLLNQMRKPKSPQIMMAQPGQAPKKPEDDL